MKKNTGDENSRQRLDHALVAEGLVESGEMARRLIYAGKVRVDGQVSAKPGRVLRGKPVLTVDAGKRFASRGGDKLEHAFQMFDLKVEDKICVDIGASTGGFTDCLLSHGARKIFAVDVGKGQLHWKLRNRPDVVIMEGVNARYLEASGFPDQIEFGCVDVSFISLQKILPAVNNIVAANSCVVALIKPQFEAGRDQVCRGGVVRDENIRLK